MSCVFCSYSGPSPVLWEDEDVFIVEPLSPVVKGHFIAVSKQHASHALEDPALTGRVVKVAAQFARGECNIITSAGEAATQSIAHLHVHVVPRSKGDGLRLPWSRRVPS